MHFKAWNYFSLFLAHQLPHSKRSIRQRLPSTASHGLWAHKKWVISARWMLAGHGMPEMAIAADCVVVGASQPARARCCWADDGRGNAIEKL